MAQTVTRWLVITLVFSLGFGQLLRFELPYATLYFHDILVLIFLVISVPNFVKNYKVRNLPAQAGFVMPPGYKYILIGIGLGWVTALLNYPITQLLVPTLYTLRLLAYLALYVVVQNARIVIPRLAFYTAGLITAFIGLTQYLLLPDMRVFQYLGWDDHLHRLTLPHFDPTFTAVMLSLSLLYVIRSRPLFSIPYSLFLICTMLLTYSRSVWLSLALTAILFIKNKRILFFAFCFLLFAMWALPKRFGEGTNLLRTYSINSRIERDSVMIRDAGWSLLTGRGYNTYVIDEQISEKGYPNHASGPNSSYVMIISTMGVIGLYGWFVFLRNLYTTTTHKASIIFVAIASLFNNILLYPFVLLWLLFLCSTKLESNI